MTAVYRFSSARLKRSLKIIGYFIAICVSLVLTVILGGGEHFIAPERVEPFRFPDDDAIDNGQTLFLFPGRGRLIIVGVIYVVSIAIIGVLTVGSALISIWRMAFRYDEIKHNLLFFETFAYHYPWVVIGLLPLVPLLLHLCGNLHWQFYCAVGAIDANNCFWVFDGRSLLIGGAGLIGLLIVCAVARLVLCVLCVLYRLACYLSCLERVDEETKELDKITTALSQTA